jgi:hypothetical protein
LISLCSEKSTYIRKIFQDKSIRFFGEINDFIPLIDDSDSTNLPHMIPDKLRKKMREHFNAIESLKGNCVHDIMRVETWNASDPLRNDYADKLIEQINRFELITVAEIESELVEIEDCLDRFDNEMLKYTEGIFYDDYSGPERRLIYDNHEIFKEKINRLLKNKISISYLEKNRKSIMKEYIGLL